MAIRLQRPPLEQFLQEPPPETPPTEEELAERQWAMDLLARWFKVPEGSQGRSLEQRMEASALYPPTADTLQSEVSLPIPSEPGMGMRWFGEGTTLPDNRRVPLLDILNPIAESKLEGLGWRASVDRDNPVFAGVRGGYANPESLIAPVRGHPEQSLADWLERTGISPLITKSLRESAVSFGVDPDEYPFKFYGPLRPSGVSSPTYTDLRGFLRDPRLELASDLPNTEALLREIAAHEGLHGYDVSRRTTDRGLTEPLSGAPPFQEAIMGAYPKYMDYGPSSFAPMPSKEELSRIPPNELSLLRSLIDRDWPHVFTNFLDKQYSLEELPPTVRPFYEGILPERHYR